MKILTLRLPDGLYERLRAEAVHDRRSLHSLILGALQDAANEWDALELERPQPLLMKDLPTAIRADLEGAAPLRLCSCGRAIDDQENCEGCGHDPLECRCDGGPLERKTNVVHHAAQPQHRAGPPTNPPRPLGDKPPCTCTQAERRHKGKLGPHLSACPAGEA